MIITSLQPTSLILSNLWVGEMRPRALNQARMENERLVNVSPVKQQAVVIPPVVATAKSTISQQFTSGSTISSASSTASQIFEAYESLPWIAQVGVGVVGIGVGVALLPPALSGLAVGTLDAVGAAFLMGAPAEAPVIAGATGAALASVGLTREAVSSVDKFGFFGRVGAESAVNETSQLSRFHQAAKSLPEEAQQNIRVLRGWAKSKGWVKAPNPEGGPEVWGVDVNGELSWRLKIKPEIGTRAGLEAGSQIPRFASRLNNQGLYINPFTSQLGGRAIGSHIPLENPSGLILEEDISSNYTANFRR